MNRLILSSAATLAALVAADRAAAANLFAPTDFIIGIDATLNATSNHPGGEAAPNAVDQNAATKYLNFSKENSGFIVTPLGGSSVVQSIQFTTANDAEERDPASFRLFGTNDAIASTNNSLGNAENWTLITTSALALPSGRGAVSSFTNFANAVGYSSYRVVFDTLKNSGAANSMQIADVQLFSGADGAGAAILGAGAPTIAIDLDAAPGSFPGGEPPAAVVDGNTGSKYLNFGKGGSGFIITPGAGPSIVDGFELFTANDAPERDPASYSIFGTNAAIGSTENSTGEGEAWSLIASGSLSLPTDRNGASSGVIGVANGTAYTSYKVIFDTVRDSATANSMQLGEIQFYGTVVPEPSTALLLAAAAGGLARRRRRA